MNHLIIIQQKRNKYVCKQIFYQKLILTINIIPYTGNFAACPIRPNMCFLPKSIVCDISSKAKIIQLIITKAKV